MANETKPELCLDLNTELWIYRQDVTTLPITMTIFAILYTLIIIIGIVGNSCVILAISRNKALQTVPNIFIMSLSCSDIIVCCISATITPITAFRKEWIFGSLLCNAILQGISLCFSTFTLTAISVDRYMLIKHPMKKPLTKNEALVVIGVPFSLVGFTSEQCIATFATIISLPTLLTQNLDVFEDFCGLYCTEQWSKDNSHWRKMYGALLLTVQFIIPLSVIIISYTAISMKIGQSLILKGAEKKNGFGSNDSNWEANLTDQQRIALKRRQRTNRMLIAMVVAFSASWFWSVAYNLLRDYNVWPNALGSQEYLFGIATHCIAMTSTIWNPILYAMLNLQLRQAFIRLLPAPWRRRFSDGGEYEKTSPLIANGNAQAQLNAHTSHLSLAPDTRLKYGATQRVTLGVPIADGTSAIVKHDSISESSNGLLKSDSYLSSTSRPLYLQNSVENSAIAASRNSLSSRRGSRKLSTIRVIVSKLSSGLSEADDDREFLVGASSPSTSSPSSNSFLGNVDEDDNSVELLTIRRPLSQMANDVTAPILHYFMVRTHSF